MPKFDNNSQRPDASARRRHSGSASRLMKAGLGVFNEMGINAASIHEICHRADVSIGSAYHHFGSKQGLADALLIEGLRSNREQLVERLGALDSAEARIRAAINSLIDWIEEHQEWARFIYQVGDMAQATRRADGSDVSELAKEHQTMIGQYFKPFVESGAMRRLPPETYAALVLGPVHDYARRWLSGVVKKPPSKFRKLFADAAWAVVGRDE